MSTIPVNDNSKYLIVEGSLRIAYDIKNANDNNANTLTFILLPSLGDIRQEYRYLAPLLHNNGLNNVISVDLRGMGQSDVNFKSYTPEDTGNDIVKLIKYLDVNNIVLIGCSMTAASIVFTASSISDKTIKGLVLISAFLWDHKMPFGIPTLLSLLLNGVIGPSFWKDYYQSLYTLKPSTVGDINEYVKLLHSNLKEKGRISALRGHIFASKESCTIKSKSIYNSKIPVLPIYGSKDPDFPKGVSEELEIMKKEYLPHINDSLVVDGCGHYPHVEEPNKVYQAIVKFLDI